MTELKMCPFCGKNELRQLGVLKKVQCINENCDHAFKDPMFPTTWNTRPIEDQLRSENERLMKALNKIIAYYKDDEFSPHDLIKVNNIARQALNEVTK